MIKSFEYSFPWGLKKSFDTVLESGQEIPDWQLVSSNEQTGIIEWEQKLWLGLGRSKIKVFLRERRTDYTLTTIYVSHPLQLIDQIKMCEKVFKKLEINLNDKKAMQ